MDSLPYGPIVEFARAQQNTSPAVQLLALVAQMSRRKGSRSASVVAIGAELSSFVGRRIRLHLRNGERREGVLLSAPMTFNAVSKKGNLVTQGRLVIEHEDLTRSFLKLEDVDTYDVLPR